MERRIKPPLLKSRKIRTRVIKMRKKLRRKDTDMELPVDHYDTTFGIVVVVTHTVRCKYTLVIMKSVSSGQKHTVNEHCRTACLYVCRFR